MFDILATLMKIDFVGTWKATSVALAGAFGILGLLTEFRNKQTKKITKWGWISLAGIVISSVFGVAAQIKESVDDSKKASVLVKKTDKTLNETERALYRLEDPTVTLMFDVPCSQEDYKLFCERLTRNNRMIHEDGDWTGWPNNKPLVLMLELFFEDEETEEPGRPSVIKRGHLSMILSNSPKVAGVRKFTAGPSVGGPVWLELIDGRPYVGSNDGQITSMPDLEHAKALLWNSTESLNGLQLKAFWMETKMGQKFGTHLFDGSELEMRMSGRQTVYTYRSNKH